MTKEITIFEVQVEEHEYNEFINSYSKTLSVEGNGMGERFLDKETGLEVARHEHGFFDDTYFLSKWKN